MKFIIHHQGSEQGPLSVQDILARLHRGDLQWTDCLYDEEKKDWVYLLEHPLFMRQMTEQPSQPLAEEKKQEETDWYVLRDANRYGPFTYLELVKMLQQRKLFEYDYVWHRSEMQAWQRISELAQFSAEKIKSLVSSGEAGPDVFYRRRHARAEYGASILLHDNKALWRGTSMEISAGGAGLVLESGEINIGQNLFLHFKAGDGVPPFNANCTVISKHETPENKYRYGVKFTSISQSVQVAIKKYTDQAA